MRSSGEHITLLRMFPDYSADPVWADLGMVDLSQLPISERLRHQLRRWARDWEDLMGVREARYAIEDEGAHQAWQERGRHLAQRLQGELGPSFKVDYEECQSP
jgi:hypothetical protein